MSLHTPPDTIEPTTSHEFQTMKEEDETWSHISPPESIKIIPLLALVRLLVLADIPLLVDDHLLALVPGLLLVIVLLHVFDPRLALVLPSVPVPLLALDLLHVFVPRLVLAPLLVNDLLPVLVTIHPLVLVIVHLLLLVICLLLVPAHLHLLALPVLP